ncbi:MAG: hypothetical protein IPK61_14605 [Saprospiraceae bacterium]|jgi:hypothetical protein|nr:hypothetical protein [Saprospiraceae bacterium]MBX7163004.1 hypothetical protein [Saprospiraceae bacterium]
MKFVIYLALLFPLFFSCKQEKASAGKTEQPPYLDITRENMTGSWRYGKNKDIAFKLDKDFFYFNEEGNFRPFTYRLEKDSFVIRYPEFEYGYTVRVFADSLHLMDDMNTNVYYRVKDE